MRIALALVVTILILQVSHTQSFVPTTKTCIFKFQQRSSECFISGDASSSYNLDFFDATSRSSSSSNSNNNSDSNNSNNRFHERKVKDEVDDDMDEYELEQYQKQVLLSQYSSTTNNSNGNSNNIPIPKNAQLVPSSSSTTSTGSSAISSDGNTIAASAYYPSVTFDLTLPSMQMLEGVILRQGLLYQKNKNSNGVKRMELMSMNTAVNPAASIDAEEEEDVPCWSVLYDNDNNNNNNNNMDNMILFEYLPSSVQNQTGLRRNDILLGTSATMGTQIWPKSTLEGIAAALQSRMLLRTDMTLRILRYADSSTITSVSTTSSAASTTSNVVENVAAEVYETYDVTLTKPLGIYVQQQLLDNTLVITNSTIHTNKVRTGDVIIAIDNGMTMNMNAVQNIEGLISSVTSRLPNQPVTLRIRRKVQFVDVGEDLTTTASIPGSDIASSSDVSKSVIVVAEDDSSTRTSSKSSVLAGAILSNAQERILLHKCRAYLNKYLTRTTTTTANTASSNTTTQLQSLYQAVSKVRDTLNTVHRSTSVTFDARTLALVLQSYITCEAYDEALTVFECATGLSAYGTDALRSTDNSSTDDNRWYLNQSTKSVDNAVCTLLLQVHAALGDFKSAARVSLAMSGKSGQFSVFVDTLPAAEWNLDAATTTSSLASYMELDLHHHNIILHACRNSVSDALLYFDTILCHNNNDKNNHIAPDIVSYNTLLSTLIRHERWSDAYSLYYRIMEQSSSSAVKLPNTNHGKNKNYNNNNVSYNAVPLQANAVTYTTLLQAQRTALGKAEEGMRFIQLLQQQSSQNNAVDSVLYNTVLAALCECQLFEKAKDLIADMERRMMMNPSSNVINVDTYTILLHHLLESKRYSTCLTLFESASMSSMDWRSLSSSSANRSTTVAVLYGIAIRAAGALRNVPKVLELYHRMRQNAILRVQSSSNVTSSNSTAEYVKVYSTILQVLLQCYTTNTIRNKDNNRHHHSMLEEVKNAIHMVLQDMMMSTAAIDATNSKNKNGLDRYALTLVIRAYAKLGDVSTAWRFLQEDQSYNAVTGGIDNNSNSSNRHERFLYGKDVMQAYDVILEGALSVEDYSLARELVQDMLVKKNYIPSKWTFASMLRGLNYATTNSYKFYTNNRNINDIAGSPSGSTEKFEFLLYVMDILAQRNLFLDDATYCAMLFEASKLNGAARRIASLIPKARRYTDENDSGSINEMMTWESLLQQNIDFRKVRPDDISLPPLRVRISSNKNKRRKSDANSSSFNIARMTNVAEQAVFIRPRRMNLKKKKEVAAAALAANNKSLL